jgi:hypothetical protein
MDCEGAVADVDDAVRCETGRLLDVDARLIVRLGIELHLAARSLGHVLVEERLLHMFPAVDHARQTDDRDRHILQLRCANGLKPRERRDGGCDHQGREQTCGHDGLPYGRRGFGAARRAALCCPPAGQGGALEA